MHGRCLCNTYRAASPLYKGDFKENGRWLGVFQKKYFYIAFLAEFIEIIYICNKNIRYEKILSYKCSTDDGLLRKQL